ncbi:glycosyl hydrolase family protein 43 [Tanacetum coccineum]
MQKSKKAKFDKHKFVVTISPNVDYAFVITLIAIVDAMKDLDKEYGVDLKSAKRHQILELEKMWMNFQRELELQNKVIEAYEDDIIDVGCFSFKDLCTWTNDGIVLPAKETDETHDLHKSNVLERPKVIYNENTGKYIMWMHIDDTNYTRAAAGTAISSIPTGPFDYIKSFRQGADTFGKQPWWYRVESDCERSEVATSA